MEMQHVNVKLLVEDPAGVEFERLIPVFNTWIQGQVFEGRLLDIADYHHVKEGPGVVLIGHDGDYSVDNTDNRLGIRYNRKMPYPGSNLDRLEHACRAALEACQRLEAEANLAAKIRFNGQDVEVFINDRLLAPNREETREALRAELNAFAEKLFRDAEYSLSFETDPRKLLGIRLKASRPFSAADLLGNLAYQLT